MRTLLVWERWQDTLAASNRVVAASNRVVAASNRVGLFGCPNIRRARGVS
jgi:hypothetical protein